MKIEPLEQDQRPSVQASVITCVSRTQLMEGGAFEGRLLTTKQCAKRCCLLRSAEEHVVATASVPLKETTLLQAHSLDRGCPSFGPIGSEIECSIVELSSHEKALVPRAFCPHGIFDCEGGSPHFSLFRRKGEVVPTQGSGTQAAGSRDVSFGHANNRSLDDE